MNMFKNVFKSVDTYLDSSTNREKILIIAIVTAVAVSILRK